MSESIAIIPESRIIKIEENQRLILEMLEGHQSPDEYLTVSEFLTKTKMGRSFFDQMVAENKIKTFRPSKRKLFIPQSEIKRFFEGE